ncbi:hypothetical protein IL54_0332 [Sphingobium sp. ba1]|nr:hypothetical protein IL54_0332 [Sphingobium sp. ba1]
MHCRNTLPKTPVTALLAAFGLKGY